ncbi:hypothetical protein BH24ACT15_BH24ACT15_34590 [soil metagenome]
MKRLFVATLALGLLMAVPGTAAADHPGPPFGTAVQPGDPVVNSGPLGAWEHLATIPTTNPQTDLDFFEQGGETYLSAGTLAAGANAAGQTIVQLTQNGNVVPPTPTLPGSGSIRYVSGHPSAECPSNPVDALGLQHDVESTPKGDTILNTFNPSPDRRDTQLLIDATDASGRCHDGSAIPGNSFPFNGVPQGGLELIDVTDVNNPVEIGLISHIGESHTVNVDPRRPHIVYSVTSDAVNVDANGRRANEDPNSSQRFNLDGFEVADISSCMNFPEGTSVADKRERCRPEVFRYRYPSAQIAIGHTVKGRIYGCHELEVYPNDRLTCGSGAAMILFNVADAFNRKRTPNNFRDDTLRGTPLPCRVRDSSSIAAFQTGAKVTDCVMGKNDQDLTIPGWKSIGSPSLTGIKRIGTAHHMGRGGPRPSTEDNDFDHEAEYTHSRKFILTTDERGGGVVPPGATCATAANDVLVNGNGGVQAHVVSKLDTSVPANAAEADQTYARTPQGDKAIFRVEPRTGAEATTCTAHVFQQIPGQNRIFMGWYSQGTQVIDYYERPDGTLEFVNTGYFIPAQANEWASHVFKVQPNNDGTFTYFGAASDFTLGAEGRGAIEVYKVTLAAPQLCEARASGLPCVPGPVPDNGATQSASNDLSLALAGLLVLPAAAFVGRRRRRRSATIES